VLLLEPRLQHFLFWFSGEAAFCDLNWDPPILSFPPVAGMTGRCHHTQLFTQAALDPKS
jgi:hypothetical protein